MEFFVGIILPVALHIYLQVYRVIIHSSFDHKYLNICVESYTYMDGWVDGWMDG